MDNHEMNQQINLLSGQKDLISDSGRIGLDGSNGNEPNGIGGWLILIAINLVWTLLSALQVINTVCITFIFNGALEELSTPGSTAYSALWKPTILFELASNILTLLLSIVLIYLFFRKKKIFPKVFIGLLLFRILVNLINAVFTLFLSKSTSIDTSSNLAAPIAQPILQVVIWGYYMLNSVRVKNTFTR